MFVIILFKLVTLFYIIALALSFETFSQTKINNLPYTNSQLAKRSRVYCPDILRHQSTDEIWLPYSALLTEFRFGENLLVPC